MGEENEQQLTEEMLGKIFANPFYCINISENLVAPHEPLVSEEDWIKANINHINEKGIENFLKNLLDVLKGNYV